MKNEFFEFVKNAKIKLTHPTKGLIDVEFYDFQKRLFEHLENHRLTLIVKFRQGGFTTFCILYALWKAVVHGQNCGFLSRTDRESKDLFRIVTLCLYHSDLQYTEYKTRKVIEFSSGGKLNFGTASYCRGRSFQLLFLDEAAFHAKLDTTWPMIWPCVVQGKVIACSTPNKASGWFFEKYQDAVKKRNDFSIFESSYLEHPVYKDKNWVKQTREALGEEGWLQEVEGKFIAGDVKLTRFEERMRRFVLQYLRLERTSTKVKLMLGREVVSEV